MAKVHGKPLRLYASRLESEGDILLCLPLGFRDALLDICERMQWSRAWVNDDREEIVLSDEQEAYVAKGIEALTMACEIVVNNQITVDPQPVTLNVTVSGGGCCSDFPVLTTPEGTDYPLIPVDPNDPLDEKVPTWDPITQTPPDGYETWQEFDADRCRAANWFVDSYLEMVENSDLIERRLSAGAAIMDVATLLIKALPGPVGEWTGTLVIIKYVGIIAGLLATTVDELEDLNDWLQFGSDKVQENKQELVCAAYAMSSVEWLKEFFATFWAGYIDPELDAAGAGQALTVFLRETFDGLFSLMANSVADGFLNQKIPADYVPALSCEFCGAAPGFSYVPMTVASVYSLAGHGTITNLQLELSTAGDAFAITGDSGAAGAEFAAELILDDPGIQTSKIYGIGINLAGPNILLVRFGDTTQSSLSDVGLMQVQEGVTHWLSGPANESYPDKLPGVRNIVKNDGINIKSCDATGYLSLTVGGTKAVANDPFALVGTEMFWIVWDSAAC